MIHQRHKIAFAIVFICFTIGDMLWYFESDYLQVLPKLLLYIPIFLIGIICFLPILVYKVKEDLKVGNF